MWFDSHCHLHLCDGDAADVVARARQRGVHELVTIGIDISSSEVCAAIASELGVLAAVGVHPNSADGWDETAHRRVDELLTGAQVVAVGETGLDFYRDRTPHSVQERAFRDHIALARKHDKALVIHTRESVGAALEVLEDEGPPDRLVFHCWSGDRDDLGRALALGAYVSFAGNVSFKSASDLRGLAAAVPADRLLVETDAPFLAPTPHRGRSNEPGFVVDVGAAVAEARGVAAEELAGITSANAERLFRS